LTIISGGLAPKGIDFSFCAIRRDQDGDQAAYPIVKLLDRHRHVHLNSADIFVLIKAARKRGCVGVYTATGDELRSTDQENHTDG